MTESTLLWLALAGLAGWNLRMQWWIVQHHRCHTAPAERLARLEARLDSCEEECGRLAENAHDDRARIAPVYLWLQMIKAKLGIE